VVRILPSQGHQRQEKGYQYQGNVPLRAEPNVLLFLYFAEPPHESASGKALRYPGLKPHLNPYENTCAASAKPDEERNRWSGAA
jgi:hypothetical protein